MLTTNKILSKEELDTALNSRISLDPYRNKKRFMEREINEELGMQQRLFLQTGAYVQDIVFDECIFNEVVDIGEFQSAGIVEFHKCVFNKPISVELANSSFSGNCIFNDNLSIQLRHYGDATISEYNVKNKFEIIGSTDKLILENINQPQDIVNQTIIIRASCKGLSIKEIKPNILEFQKNMQYDRSVLIENIEVRNLIIKAINLNAEMKINTCLINKVEIDNIFGNVRDLIISDSAIEEMEFPINSLLKTSIQGCTIGNLELFKASEQQSILNIEKATITNLKFRGVFNYGQITLRELIIPENGIISFKSSNLGKTDFIYCNFSKATLEFENSKITESFFSETEFPKKVLVNGKTNYRQAQLTFGQLSTAFQKQGDNIRALEYSSRELESHYQSIEWFSLDFFQKLNLWLNAISNEFGRNWIRGVIFSFAIGLFFFCLLLVSTDKYRFGLPHIDFNMLPAFFKFMNPLRFYELEDLFKNTPIENVVKLNGISYLADFAGRIFLAYAYYQTIQAFRRFGRK